MAVSKVLISGPIIHVIITASIAMQGTTSIISWYLISIYNLIKCNEFSLKDLFNTNFSNYLIKAMENNIRDHLYKQIRGSKTILLSYYMNFNVQIDLRIFIKDLLIIIYLL